MGMNSIVIYVGSDLCFALWPFNYAPASDSFLQPNQLSHAFSLTKDLINVTLWLIIANWMHLEKFYISV